ncbi:sulfate transporter [Histoplasma capsulatum H143]|uniref:Sulfate transporter n=1 Tax=Ajellomyces capsulatus (strain H143) TaxID=544712 RepID=C6HTJ6_AJECH|nr:sulfate transporter [Histoplasma capsulatum H143]
MVIAAGLELASVGESLNTARAWDLTKHPGSGNASGLGRSGSGLSDAEKKQRWTVMMVTVGMLVAFKNDGIGFLAGMVCHWTYSLPALIEKVKRKYGEGRIRLPGTGRSNDFVDYIIPLMMIRLDKILALTPPRFLIQGSNCKTATTPTTSASDPPKSYPQSYPQNYPGLYRQLPYEPASSFQAHPQSMPQQGRRPSSNMPTAAPTPSPPPSSIPGLTPFQLASFRQNATW